MNEVAYSLVIEATRDPHFFGFFSPDLGGFTGIGYSLEDCFRKAKEGMKEHLALMKREKFPIPKPPAIPTITIPITHPETGEIVSLSAKVRPAEWSLKGFLRAIRAPGVTAKFVQRGKFGRATLTGEGRGLAEVAEQFLKATKPTDFAEKPPTRVRQARKARRFKRTNVG